jgi:hypothetical protein
MNAPPTARLARRLFGGVRRERPSDELRARILMLGRAELERARGGAAIDAPRSEPRSLEEGPDRAAASRPARATHGRRWLALGALAAAASVLVYLGADSAPGGGVMISAERTGPPTPAAAASVPRAPAEDEVAPSPSRPQAAQRDEVSASGAKRPSPRSTRPTPEPTKPESRKPEPTKPSAATPPAEAPRASLGEQLEQLKLARAALRAGDHQRALQLLDAYRAQPTGRELGAEASLLRIEALALSGQRDAAAREARQFASDYPNSPLIDRALSYAGAAER